jgi:hypothetical protein
MSISKLWPGSSRASSAVPLMSMLRTVALASQSMPASLSSTIEWSE